MNTRKELKETYRQAQPPMGVFQVKNKQNEKILVDASLDMRSKWNRHRTELRFGCHRNEALQKDWQKSGEDNFVFEVLSEIAYQEEGNPNYNKELQELKKMYLEELQPYADKGYNVPVEVS